MCWQRVEEARCRRRLQSPSETEWPSVFSEVPFRMSASPTFLVATLAALLLASPTPVLSGRVAQLPPLAPAKSSVAPSVATSLAPTRVTLRVSSSQHKVHPSLRSSVVAIEVDHARLEVFAQLGGGLLDDVPLPSRQTVTLELLPMTPFESDAVIEAVTTPTAKSKGLARTSIDAAGTYLWGSVAGADGSRAFLASTDAGTYGFMELDGHTYIISSGLDDAARRLDESAELDMQHAGRIARGSACVKRRERRRGGWFDSVPASARCLRHRLRIPPTL